MSQVGFCLQTMTMKKIRHQLNAVFGVDLSDRKEFLGLQVCRYNCAQHQLLPSSAFHFIYMLEPGCAQGCVHDPEPVLLVNYSLS